MYENRRIVKEFSVTLEPQHWNSVLCDKVLSLETSFSQSVTPRLAKFVTDEHNTATVNPVEWKLSVYTKGRSGLVSDDGETEILYDALRPIWF